MKVRIRLSDGKWTCTHTGKGIFALSLIPELRNLGIEVTDSLEEHVDIDMQIGRWHYEPQNCDKTILRIGPVHVDIKKNHKWLNKRKKRAYKKADGIIYQSKFGMKMVKAFIGEPRGVSTIINNGSKINDNWTIATKYYKHNFLACAYTWLKQKRLSAIVRAYWKAKIKDSCLWVAGDTGENGGAERDPDLKMEVKKIGLVDTPMLRLVQTICDVQIHMVWLDCMPNSVCEAIANGCKVICNNEAGTKEVVGPSGGVVLHTDPKWNRKPVNINKPPVIDTDMLANAMRGVLNCPKPNTEIVDIRNVAKRYVSFFEEVLNG